MVFFSREEAVIMEQLVVQSISRQAKGAQLLAMLLEEEHRLLRAGTPQAVAGVELMVQELVRQLAAERALVRRLLGGLGVERVGDLMAQMEEDSRAKCAEWLQALEAGEQKSARQSMINMDLAEALLAQTRGLLARIQRDVLPRESHVYTARGMWQRRAPDAALVHGRL
jgi:hypothetical protein